MAGRCFLPAALALAACAGSAAAFDDVASVLLREGADVAAAAVTLGDVAEVRSADPGMRLRLAALPLGAAPRGGRGAVVTQGEVEALLRRQGQGFGPVTVGGAAQTAVRLRGQPLAPERLIDAAALALFHAWAAAYEGFEAKPVGAPPELALPAGTPTLSARLPDSSAVGRRMVVHVDVAVDGRPWATVPVWFAVGAQHTVLVARAPVAVGEALGAAAFAPERRDVTQLAAAPLRADAPLADLRARAALAPDTVLTAAHVEQRPAVARNEQVHVQVRLGSVALDTVGIALADARIGDSVRVRNAASNESFSARVVAEGTVQLVER